MKWEEGRQGTGYKILKLFESKFLRFDMYLIKYEVESYVSRHVDPVAKGKHYRLNIELSKADSGGKFVCSKTIFSLFNRIHLFRPDNYHHCVTKITKGSRLVFSVGKVI